MNRPQWQILLAAALTIVILYWVIGARIGAGHVQRQLQEQLARTTTQTLTLDQLRFNPFTLSATFAGLRVDDAEFGPVLTAATGRLHLTFYGLFNDATVVSDLLLDQPHLVIAISGPPGNHQLHMLGGLTPAATEGPERPPIRVVHAQITNGLVTIYDVTDSDAVPTPSGIHVGDINLTLTNLISDATTAATFDLAARINESGALGAQGSWVPASHTVEAAVQLSGLVLTPFSKVFNTWFPDTQLAGQLAADGDFEIVADNAGFSGALAIEELTVKGRSGNALLSASGLAAHGLTIGNGRPVANIQWLELDHPGVALVFGVDGYSNLHPFIASSLVQVEKVTVRDGQVGVTDKRLPSTVQINVHSVAGELSKSVNELHQTLNMSLTGALADTGRATLDGVYHINDGQVQAEGNATLGAADARLVSAYVTNWIAHEIAGGVMDLNLHYAIDDTGLTVSNTIALADLELKALAQNAPPSNLPVALTLALLTDEHGRMVVELPVNVPSLEFGDAIQKGFGNALTHFINATTSAPMNTMARLAGLPADAMGRFEFAAGSTEIRPEAEQQLNVLVDALKHRPLLGVRLMGHYAVPSDSEALARRQVELHIALAASTSAGDSSVVSGLDFTDPKVQAVLDEFAAARLDTTEFKAPTTAIQNEGNETDIDAVPSYYPAVFEALAAKEAVSDYALRQLARYRARSLSGRLQDMGVDTQRLEVDKKATPVQSGGVSPAVTLTLFAYGNPGE